MMTYSEQLKHPNWQRMRLRVLEKHNFSCAICGDDESTLHVHHKKYIKGRMAWEYEESNFDPLCENCHKTAHKAKDAIHHVMASVPSVFWENIADLLIGYYGEWDGVSDDWEVQSRLMASIGKLAHTMERALCRETVEEMNQKISVWDVHQDLPLVIPARNSEQEADF